MKTTRLLAAGLLVMGLPMAAMAQVAQNVNVQVQVNGSCNLTAPVDANFGAQTPLVATNLTASGAVTLRCNAGALPVLSVGNGNNFSGGRRMTDGTNFVAYSVKQPTISGTNYTVCPAFGGGTDWSTGLNALSASAAFTASGGNRTVNLCFQTTVDQNTPVATYTDTVQVSVTF